MFVDIKGCKLFFDVYGSKLKILPDRIIEKPSLFMVGEESPLHPPARALEMAAAIRTGLAQVHIFKGAGAPVYNDSLEEALNVVRDFIQKIAEETLAHAR